MSSMNTFSVSTHVDVTSHGMTMRGVWLNHHHHQHFRPHQPLARAERHRPPWLQGQETTQRARRRLCPPRTRLEDPNDPHHPKDRPHLEVGRLVVDQHPQFLPLPSLEATRPEMIRLAALEPEPVAVALQTLLILIMRYALCSPFIPFLSEYI